MLCCVVVSEWFSSPVFFACLSVESCGMVGGWYSVVVWSGMMDHLWLDFIVGLVPGVFRCQALF